MNLKNKNILVTGAGKGIGFVTVNTLIKDGAFVYAIVKDKKDNKKFKDYRNLLVFNGRVENVNLLQKILKSSKKIKKPIHGLVNNAGIRFRKKFTEIKKKEIQNVFDVNFFSAFFLMQTLSKYFIKNKIKGSIINIASIVGRIGFSELSAYASSKGALTALTQSFAVEMSRYGIKTNTISPGFIKTSYYKKFKNKKRNIYNWTLSRIPMKRWGEPDEISNLVSYLLSDKSTYINGENINIDGGWLNS